MKVVTWIVGAPLAAVAVVFSVANRGVTRIDLWPLPFSVDAPVYLLVLGALVVGLLVGALMAWLSAGRLRARLRERNGRVAELEREAALMASRTTLPADNG